MRRDYQLGEFRFREMGISYLANRAKQRFLFALAAEEILHSLTSPDPHKELNHAWYVEKSGAASHHVFVENDEVKLSPSVLLSFVVGVQVSRVRKCVVCENYFWAGRKDKRVCSEQCGATNRKRQERQRYFEVKVGNRIATKRQNRGSTARKAAPVSRDRSRFAKKGK